MPAVPGTPLERKPDIDRTALEALLRRAFGSTAPIAYQRTPDGVSTQVYRLDRGDQVLYLRLAEDERENLAVEEELYRQLRQRGVHVPDVVYLEPFDPAIRRSVLITTEIPGEPLAQTRPASAGAFVARAAGRDLAILNQVAVQGFGWIRREGPAWPLRAELATYFEFVTWYLRDAWPGALGSLFSTAQLDAIEAIIDAEQRRELLHGQLAHGDFDVTAILQEDGQYTGLIDFGEMRGTEPLYDLGHFHLHDGETFPMLLLQHLLEGYREVVDLPPDYPDQIRRSAILLGLRQLCRWIGPERNGPLDHPSVTHRAKRITELITGSGKRDVLSSQSR